LEAFLPDFGSKASDGWKQGVQLPMASKKELLPGVGGQELLNEIMYSY